jgi:hypothetical protein
VEELFEEVKGQIEDIASGGIEEGIEDAMQPAKAYYLLRGEANRGPFGLFLFV